MQIFKTYYCVAGGSLKACFQAKKFGVSNGGIAATSNPVSQVLW